MVNIPVFNLPDILRRPHTALDYGLTAIPGSEKLNYYSLQKMPLSRPPSDCYNHPILQ